MTPIAWILLAPFIVLSWSVCVLGVFLIYEFLKAMRSVGK